MTAMKIITSENDKRLYRVITLENGLRAMLVSTAEVPDDDDDGTDDDDDEDGDESMDDDATSDSGGDNTNSEYSDSSDKSGCSREKMAAAALAVRCGGFQGPSELPGLSHYLEHMLFMGSEKYPRENEYSEFISMHGGTENAFTDTEMTVYYFDVSQPAFPKALDMFANFFVNPLFREDCLQREVEAVESEFQLHQSSDETRMEQVLCEQAGADHPMGRFLWGNLKSLKEIPAEQGISVRDALVNVYQSYYSPEVMTLCVVSKNSLDELEGFVRESFSSVPKRECTAITYPSGLPFSDNPNFCKLFKVVPINRNIIITFRWVLPSQKPHYKEKSLDYLGYIIGHEGKNSILDLLRQKQWALALTAGPESDSYSENSMCALFEISVTLSEEGAQNVAEVTKYIHQYLNMLRKKGPQKWLWDELKEIAEFDFRFEDEDEAQDYACDLSQAMQEYPEEHYLCGRHLYMEYNPQSIQSLLEQMTPDKCNTMYQNYEFQKCPDKFPHQERWMNVLYSIEDYPIEWKDKWIDDPEFQEMLHLPEPNKFIPTDFSLKEDKKYAQEKCPVKISDGSTIRVWYQKDEKFFMPRCFINTHFISSSAYANAHNAVCIDVMNGILGQLLAQTNNYAEMASIEFEINSYISGLIICFSGFNHKLPLLFDTVMDAIINFDCSDPLFQTIKLDLHKHFYNNVLVNRYYADEIRSMLIHQTYFSMAERRNALKLLTKKDVIENTRKLCRDSFVEAYVHGNVTSIDALHLIEDLQTKLASQPTVKEVKDIHTIFEGETYVRFLSINPEDKNSRIINYYIYGPAHFYEETMMQFLESLMEERCFKQLRTDQQLGYDACCSMNNYRGIIGFSVSVSSAASKFTLSHVDERIDDFVDKMVDTVKELSEEEFTTVRDALVKLKQCVDLSMEDAQYRNWNQIRQFQYQFDRNELEVKFLKELDLERFRRWCLRVLTPGEFGRKKLSVQLVGYGKDALEECEGGSEIWEEFQAKTVHDDVNDDPEIPPLRLLKPKLTNGKRFMDNLSEFLNSRKFYACVNRSPNQPIQF